MAAAKTQHGKSGAKRKAANFAAKNNRRGTRKRLYRHLKSKGHEIDVAYANWFVMGDCIWHLESKGHDIDVAYANWFVIGD